MENAIEIDELGLVAGCGALDLTLIFGTVMRWINGFILFFLAYGLIFVPTQMAGILPWKGVKADFLPALILYVAIRMDMGVLGGVAIFGGIGVDSLSWNPVGVSILPLFLMGWIMYVCRNFFSHEKWIVQWFLGVTTTLGVTLMTGALLASEVFSTSVQPLFGGQRLWQWILVGLMGGVITPVLFWCADRMFGSLVDSPVVQSAFNPDREIERGRL